MSLPYGCFPHHWLVGFNNPVTRHAGPCFPLKMIEVDTAIYHSLINNQIPGDIRCIFNQIDITAWWHNDLLQARVEKLRCRYKAPIFPSNTGVLTR